MQDEKLIEEIAVLLQDFWKQDGRNPSMWSRDILSVIRQNVHLVAEVCPECGGQGGNYYNEGADDIYQDCPKCQSSGIIAKQERVN